jgi:hypothetical protein
MSNSNVKKLTFSNRQRSENCFNKIEMAPINEAIAPKS